MSLFRCYLLQVVSPEFSIHFSALFFFTALTPTWHFKVFSSPDENICSLRSGPLSQGYHGWKG